MSSFVASSTGGEIDAYGALIRCVDIQQAVKDMLRQAAGLVTRLQGAAAQHYGALTCVADSLQNVAPEFTTLVQRCVIAVPVTMAGALRAALAGMGSAAVSLQGSSTAAAQVTG